MEQLCINDNKLNINDINNTGIDMDKKETWFNCLNFFA